VIKIVKHQLYLYAIHTVGVVSCLDVEGNSPNNTASTLAQISLKELRDDKVTAKGHPNLKITSCTIHFNLQLVIQYTNGDILVILNIYISYITYGIRVLQPLIPLFSIRL